MEHTESFKRTEEALPSFDGVSLHVSKYERIKPKAHVILVPQFGCFDSEYINKYGALWDAGYALHTFDLRGHGGSSGGRFFIKRMEDLLDDIDLLIARIKDNHPGEPIYLVGDGVGAWMALGCSLRQGANIAGVVLNQFAMMPEVSTLQKTRQAVLAWFSPQKSGPLAETLPGILPGAPDLALPSRSIYELTRLHAMIRDKIIELICPCLALTGETDRQPVAQLLGEAAVGDVTYAKTAHDDATAGSIVSWMDERYKYAAEPIEEMDED